MATTKEEEEEMELLQVSATSAGSTSALPGSGWGGEHTGRTDIFSEPVQEEGGCEKFGR